MSDPNEKGSESSASAGSSDEGQSTDLKKTCVDCGTSKTPLWRGGPAGPKSLCNACGIRSRKKRRVVVGINKSGGGADEIKKPKKNSGSGGGLKLNLHRTGSNGSKTKLGSDPWKRKLLVGLRSEVSKQRRNKMGEVEQAAALLMALSYGSVYA